MSLMGTLGKVALGIMVAKGVGKMMNNRSGGGGASGGGLGGLLGGLTGGGSSGGSGGGLGGLLGGLTGGASGGSSAGGLGGLLGGLTGQSSGAGSSGGGLGGLLNSLGGGTNTTQPSSGGNQFGDLFNTALKGNEPAQVNNEDEQKARLMLRAMISAAKADGHLDDDERRKITEHLDGASPEEQAFVQQELQAPVDLQGLIRSVPAGMEQQVYLMSLLAISLDSTEEATYLDQLAKGLNISNEASNQIHDKLGAPKLYR